MVPKFESKCLGDYLKEDLLDEPDYFLELLGSLDNLFNESNDTAYLSAEINDLISLLYKEQQNENNNN